jgi:hypothetical protein
VKKGKLRDSRGDETEKMYDIPGGIIANVTRECGGNVHDHDVVEVTCGSFEKETYEAIWYAKNAIDLETDSLFASAFRMKEEDIPHTRNNWVCYDFKERRIVPTHYAIRTYNWNGSFGWHLKLWLVETLADGKNWRDVAREWDNEQLNGWSFTATFTVTGGGECRFIRLVNKGRNHFGTDRLVISAWEIFGSLVE